MVVALIAYMLVRAIALMTARWEERLTGGIVEGINLWTRVLRDLEGTVHV